MTSLPIPGGRLGVALTPKWLRPQLLLPQLHQILLRPLLALPPMLATDEQTNRDRWALNHVIRHD